jgi:hypothetical protein
MRSAEEGASMGDSTRLKPTVNRMEATLNGVTWRAEVSVRVSRIGNLVAISGTGGEGATLTLAFWAEVGTTLHRLEDSPANAMLTTPTGEWLADGVTGSGHIALQHLRDSSLTGTFDLELVRAASDAAPRIRWLRGWFSVALPEPR